MSNVLSVIVNARSNQPKKCTYHLYELEPPMSYKKDVAPFQRTQDLRVQISVYKD